MAITKLGKEIKNNKKKNIDESLGIFAKSILPTAGVQLGTGLAATPLALAGLANSKNQLSKDESRKLINLMTKGKNVNVVDSGNSLLSRLGARYNGLINTVYAPKDSYALAHELGHATGPIANKFTKIPASLAYSLGNKAIGARFLEAAQRGYNRAKGYSEEDDSKALSGLSTATKIGTGYQLAEEGQATIRGLNAIKKLQGWRGVGRAAKDLLPAYGTYLLQAAASHGIAPRLGEMYGRYLAKKD